MSRTAAESVVEEAGAGAAVGDRANVDVAASAGAGTRPANSKEDGSRPDDAEVVVRTTRLRKVFVSYAADGKVLSGLRRVRLGGFERLMAQAWTLIAPRRRVVAVEGVDLTIRKGELYGLLGPNGSGKSTTIKIILGLLAATAGEARVFGKRPEHTAVKQRIGFLPEETYLYKFLTADETLDFYGQLFNLPKRVRRERADRLIDMVGLEHARNRRLGEYSKGMARRLGLAQALINEPELLILDEPTTGLDPIGVAEMKQMLIELKAKGCTILMCSHLLADVEEICDRVAIMCDGELLVEGALSELLAYRDVLEVRIDRTDEAFEQRLREFVRAEGANVVAAENPSDSLSRLFLRLVDKKRPGSIDDALKNRLGIGDDASTAGENGR